MSVWQLHAVEMNATGSYRDDLVDRLARNLDDLRKLVLTAGALRLIRETLFVP